MADKKISELTAADALTGAELVELVQGGVNKQTTTQDIADLGAGGVSSVNGETGAVTGFAKLASPALTGTPTVNGESVAPGLEPVDRTGTAIQFDVPATYGSVASPETGNITLNATGLVKGMVQLCLHNNAGIAPTIDPSVFFKIGGSYQTNELNSIYFHAVSATRIEYTINQTT